MSMVQITMLSVAKKCRRLVSNELAENMEEDNYVLIGVTPRIHLEGKYERASVRFWL